MKSTLVCVIWDDAHGSDGTLAAHEIDHKPYRYTLVGFLVKSDAAGVSVAHERGDDGKFRDITFVPRVIVVNEYSLGSLKKIPKKMVVSTEEIPFPPAPAEAAVSIPPKESHSH